MKSPPYLSFRAERGILGFISTLGTRISPGACPEQKISRHFVPRNDKSEGVEMTVTEGMFLKYFFFGILLLMKVKYFHAKRSLYCGIRYMHIQTS